MKHKFLFITLLLTSILLWSCKDDSEEPAPEPPTPSEAAYSSLHNKFEKGLLLKSFTTTSLDKYTATFSDNSTLEFSDKSIPVHVCTPMTWPSVRVNYTNKWIVDDTYTEIELNTPKKCIVTLIYDTDGLYVRSSDGQILFFHFDEARQIGCYRFEAALNSQLSNDIVCTVNASQITASLPSGVTATQMIATVGYRGSKMEFNGMGQVSSITPNDFSSPLTFNIIGFNGGQQELEVRLNSFKNIPIVRITTENNAEIVSKEDYIKARITINDPDHLYSTSDVTDVVTEIRGRGNSTWNMEKKPYKLKLDKKASLLGMSTDKEWALLANHSDKTLMRNYIIFELSRMLKMAWTPQVRPVELYLNGTYKGVYMLTEHVKVSNERVNVSVVGNTDNTGDAVTGGYFVEIDERYDGVNFTTNYSLPIVFKEPKEPTQQQLDYLKQYFNQAEATLYGTSFTSPTTGYAAYIDVESFIANYIVQELSKNIDGNMRLSSFFSKDRNGKIKFCNVWDFDIALGNANYFSDPPGNGPTGFYVKGSRWYNRLFQDPAFVAKLKTEWNRIYPQLYRLEVAARAYATQVQPAQVRNFQTWPILGKWTWPNVVWPSSYKEEVNYMVNFLNERARWMDSQISTW